jgi:hypothetical protein
MLKIEFYCLLLMFGNINFILHNLNFSFDIFLTRICSHSECWLCISVYYWRHGKLGRCVIQLSKFLNHTLATHNQVDSFFENINHNDGKGAFTLTLFEMTITDCPGFHVPHCTMPTNKFRTPNLLSFGKMKCSLGFIVKISDILKLFSQYFKVHNVRLTES